MEHRGSTYGPPTCFIPNFVTENNADSLLRWLLEHFECTAFGIDCVPPS